MKLSEIDRKIVELRDNNGKSFKSIADQFGITTNGARTKYNRTNIYMGYEENDPIAKLDILPSTYKVLVKARIQEKSFNIENDIDLYSIDGIYKEALTEFSKYGELYYRNIISKKSLIDIREALMKEGYKFEDVNLDIGLSLVSKTLFDHNIRYIEFNISDTAGILKFESGVRNPQIFLEKQSAYPKAEILKQLLQLLKDERPSLFGYTSDGI